MSDSIRSPIGGKVSIGTSGWSYQDWVGPFYAKGTSAGAYLQSYATRFGVVEVDSTFYAVPSQSTVEGWAKKTPQDFRFTLKVPSPVTHGARGERPNPDAVLRDLETLELFFRVLEPLVPKIAAVLFQFPYFRVRTINADEFRDRLAIALDRVPAPIRAAVEIRNRPWLTPDFLSFLRDRGIAATFIDHPYMPSPRSQLELGMVTTDFAYIRLLGDRYAIEKKTTRWNQVIEDKSRRLLTWADIIHDMLRRQELGAVYVFANNHFAGHAPATCRELAEQVTARLAESSV